MIIRLTPDNIVAYWDTIKYASLKTMPLLEDKHVPEFCRNLLANLLTGKAQCFFILREDRIINVSITRVQSDVGEVPFLLIDSSYGFEGSTDEEKKDYIEAIMTLARNRGYSRVLAYSANPMAINAMKKLGMREVFKVMERKAVD